jgi:hypothetical protein
MNKLLTPEEVRDLLRISLPQLCRLTKLGRIPAKDVGAGRQHCWRYDPMQIEKWLNVPAHPSGDATVKKRIRRSTSVRHSVDVKNQLTEIQSENGKTHGTVYPMIDGAEHA